MNTVPGLLLAVMLWPVLSGGCGGQIVRCVVVTGPGEESSGSFDSVQLALDRASSGAVLSICPNPPIESITVHRAVTLRGLFGTRLQGLSGAPTLRIEPAKDSVVVVQDLSLVAPDDSDQPALVVSGAADVRGNGLSVESGADPQTFGVGYYGLVQVEASSLALTGSTIHNGAAGPGAAITARAGATVVVDASEIRSAGQDNIVLSASDLTLTNVDLDKSAGTALRMAGGTAHLDDARFADAGSTAMAFTAVDVVAKDSGISGAGQRGIDAVGGTVALAGVTIVNVGEDGIHTEGTALQASDVSVTTAVGNGIEVTGGSLEVDHSAVTDCGGNGLAATSCTGSVRSTSVGAITGSGVVCTLANVQLSSVFVQGAARNGLEIAGGSVQADLLRSEAQGRYGILLGAGAFLACTTCTLVGGIEGVRASGSSLLQLTSSSITAPKNYGVDLLDGSLAWISDTNIAGAWNGILVQDQYAQCTATGVTVSSSGDSGVVLNAGLLTFTQSSVSGSGSDGLLVTGGTVTVIDSSFVSNGLDGISLQGTTQAQVKATVESNGEWGLRCDGGAASTASSSVKLQICDLVTANNVSGSTQLINGCQDPPCTVQPP